MVKTSVKYTCDRCGKETEFCADGSGEYKKTLEWGRISVDSHNSTKYNLCPDCFTKFSKRLKSFINEYMVDVYFEINDGTFTMQTHDYDKAYKSYLARCRPYFYMYEVYRDKKKKYLYSWNLKSFNFVGDVND